MDLKGLFSFLGWFRLSEAQVPELVGDEVELAKDNPRARLHLLRFVAKVEDNSHLKHNNKSE